MVKAKAKIGGVFTFEHWRGGKLIGKSTGHNIVTNEGLNKLLDSALHNDGSTTWYIALFEDNHDPLAGDTYAVPGFTECTAYDEATRPEYEEAAASGQSITNIANKAVFTFNDTKTIYGGALVNVNTKGDTVGGGVLFCAGQSDPVRPVVTGDILHVSYALSASDDGE